MYNTLNAKRKIAYNAKLALAFTVISVCVMMCSTSAFALFDVIADGYMADWEAKIVEIYNLVSKIIKPVAVVALAICALRCLIPSEDSFEKNIARIIYVLVAVAVFYLLPHIVQLARTLLDNSGVQPGGLPMPTNYPVS